MELTCISLENTNEAVFYFCHQDAENLISKNKIDIGSCLSIAQQLYLSFSTSHLMI